MKTVQIIVWGDVQGVSYRYFAKKKAKELDLFGFAQNNHDGTVKILAQGVEGRVNEFIEWVKIGSPMARVERTEVIEVEPVNNLKGFEVK